MQDQEIFRNAKICVLSLLDDDSLIDFIMLQNFSKLSTFGEKRSINTSMLQIFAWFFIDQSQIYYNKAVIQSTPMAEFSFGFTEGSLLLLKGQKHYRSVAEDLISKSKKN